MEYEARKTLLVVLYNMAASDNKMTTTERQFIQAVLAKNQDIDLTTLSKNYSIPEAESDRMKIIYHSIFLLAADGVFTSNEIQVFKKLVLEMGFRPELGKKFVETFLHYDNESIPQDALLNIVKSYLN